MSDPFATPWIVTCQAPLSMGFPRQEYWSGLPFPFPGDLPDPRIKRMSSALAGRFFTIEPLGNPIYLTRILKIVNIEIFLVVQGLGLQASMQRAQVQSLGKELRSCMLSTSQQETTTKLSKSSKTRQDGRLYQPRGAQET